MAGGDFHRGAASSPSTTFGIANSFPYWERIRSTQRRELKKKREKGAKKKKEKKERNEEKRHLIESVLARYYRHLPTHGDRPRQPTTPLRISHKPPPFITTSFQWPTTYTAMNLRSLPRRGRSSTSTIAISTMTKTKRKICDPRLVAVRRHLRWSALPKDERTNML